MHADLPPSAPCACRSSSCRVGSAAVRGACGAWPRGRCGRLASGGALQFRRAAGGTTQSCTASPTDVNSASLRRSAPTGLAMNADLPPGGPPGRRSRRSSSLPGWLGGGSVRTRPQPARRRSTRLGARSSFTEQPGHGSALHNSRPTRNPPTRAIGNGRPADECYHLVEPRGRRSRRSSPGWVGAVPAQTAVSGGPSPPGGAVDSPQRRTPASPSNRATAQSCTASPTDLNTVRPRTTGGVRKADPSSISPPTSSTPVSTAWITSPASSSAAPT